MPLFFARKNIPTPLGALTVGLLVLFAIIFEKINI